MPIITSKTGGASNVPFIPPAEAFNKPRQILRRQPPSSKSVLSGENRTNNSDQPTIKEGDPRYSSLVEREKAYLDARGRIFGINDTESSSNSPVGQPDGNR
jgi:SUZ domain